MPFHAIIPAGGAGRRLWPVSTPQHPKFLMSFDDSGKTLSQKTALRLANLCDSITFVTGSAHLGELRSQINALNLKTPVQMYSEPSPRNSMAAIGLGAAMIERRYGISLIGSFPADHHIGGLEAFRTALAAARRGAKAGKLITIGITPREPATGYGYIEVGKPLGQIPSLHLVNQFHEKPDEQRAREYLSTGRYLWNAGIFLARTDVLLDALEREAPGSPAALRELAEKWETLDESGKANLWNQVIKAPIDTVLAEPMSRRGEVAVVSAPSEIDWSDVGDWEAIFQLSRGDVLFDSFSSENESKSTSPRLLGSPESLVKTETLRGVAVVGIPHAVIVEAGGKLLVTTRENAQKVRDASLAADAW